MNLEKEIIPYDLTDHDTEDFVVKIKEYAQILWVGKYYILLFAFLFGMGFFIHAKFQKPIYEATSTISIDIRPPEIVQNQVYGGLSWFEINYYIAEQVRVLKSRRLAEKVISTLALGKDPLFAGSKDPAARFASMVRIEHEEDSNILNISMRGENPEKIVLWVNTLVDEYSRLNIADSIAKSQKILEVIQDRLNPLMEQLKESERKLTEFKEKNNYYFSDETKDVITEQISKLNEEYAKAKVERINLESKMQALNEMLLGKRPLTSLPELLDNPSIQQLNNERIDLEVQLTELKKKYKAQHPSVKALEKQLQDLQKHIQEEISSAIRALEMEYTIKKNRENSLFENIKNLKEEAITLSKTQLEYEKIRQEYEQNKRFYEDMLQRSKELNIATTVNLNRVRVIDPAIRPNHPLKPDIRRSGVLGVLLGLFVGCVFVVGLDFLDNTIRAPEDVERYLKLPVISVVPTYSPEKIKVMREFYQTIRTAVIFSKKAEGCQVVQITSSSPGEGKTTTAINLAKTLAAAGEKVLLLDCDYRRPAVHRHFHFQNQLGISSYLLGEPAEEIIHKTELSNLWVITTGPIPPNPPELITRKKFAQFLEGLKEQFHWIILDSPPIVSVTDPVLLSTYADMVILVIRYNEVDRKVIRHAIQALQNANARIIGTVINDVDFEEERRYKYHYYYYYYKGYETPIGAGQPKARRKKA